MVHAHCECIELICQGTLLESVICSLQQSAKLRKLNERPITSAFFDFFVVARTALTNQETSSRSENSRSWLRVVRNVLCSFLQ
jgi:hypothetical protein